MTRGMAIMYVSTDQQETVDHLILAMNAKKTLQTTMPMLGVVTFKIVHARWDHDEARVSFLIDAMFSEEVSGIIETGGTDTQMKILAGRD
jgi:hypothetical protein